MFREAEFENHVIKIFQEIGYTYIDSEKMIMQRKDLGTTLLLSNLEDAIRRINHGISQAQINSVVDHVRKTQDINVIEGNKNALKALTEGVKVYDSIEELTKTYNIIDFENIDNNEFIITDQFRMTSNHANYTNQIPDLVVYINGLPVSVIELKSPMLDESKSIEDAYDQIKNYQNNMPTLFTWNIVNAISNMHINRYGSLTASYSRYSNWRSKNTDITPYEYFFQSLYDKDTLLKVLKDFSFYTTGDHQAKIVAGYHQVIGVTEATKKVIEAMDNGTGKAGIFWHTQGSGKSLSMVFLTRQVNNIKRKMTTLIITDRKDLDEQLSQTFMSAGDYLGQEIKQIESIDDLKNTLQNRIQNGIYLCTVQKFDESIGELSNRDDILIISDEAHRSHKNIHGRLALIEDEFAIVEKFGHAYYLRNAFPKATFMGFTGTPIENDDHQTKQIFGGYATKYLMTDATEDGFVVPIAYESRHAQLKIVEEKRAELDRFYNEIRNEVIGEVDLKAEVQKNMNKKIQKMDLIIGDPQRIEEIAADFVEHYRSRQNLLKGKAMFVAYNRETAFKYYKEIIKNAPELKKNIRLILTANNQKDSNEMLELIGNDKFRKDSATIFKDPNSDFKIAIVVDMWLTGFDAPCLDTIYLDKPIKMHNLMQTIARVNRVYTDKENKDLVKESGLVVDYIGLWSKLKDAMEFYTTGGDKISDITMEDSAKLKTQLLAYVREIYKEDLSDRIDIDIEKIDDKDYLFELVEDIQKVVISKRQKQQFVNRVKKATQGFPAIVTSCTIEEKVIIQLLMNARSMLIKRELGQIEIDTKVKEIKERIAESIIHNRTIICDSLEDEKISLTDILNYIVSVNPKQSDELDGDKLAAATNLAIKALRILNMVKSEQLTKKLELLLEKYDSNHISHEEFMVGLKDVGQEVFEAKEEAENSDKDIVELAFFSILREDVYSQNQYDKAMIEKITKELYSKVRPMLDKRWIYNESIKQRVRSEMKKILIKYDYPPKETIELQERLIKQLQAQIYSGVCQLEEV